MSSPEESTPFDVTGPLPRGTVVLEASAGTGKTWTVAALVVRVVAEGRARLDQVLAVTFSRAATAELRTRVRERLRDVHVALRDGTGSTDPVVVLLRAAEPDELARRTARLAAAVAGFDAATVATTHEFCSAVLRTLGTAADLDPGTVLVEDLSELVTEVVDDLLLRGAAAGTPLPFDRATAQRLAAAAVADREAELLPARPDREPGSEADLRVRFAAGVRTEVAARCRSRRVLGYDDLLTRVRDALRDPVSGPVAAQRLRDRYRVVLVDEFQDTDPVQWEVLRTAFKGHVDLLVIGDPKQAVYAFRGADVRSYLAAAAEADAAHDLVVNHRSDPGIVDGLSRLFRGAQLGAARIRVRPVVAAREQALLAPQDAAPVRVRVLPREGLRPWKGYARAEPARRAVAEDVAGHVRSVLAEGLTVRAREGSAARALSPRDVAVLVRTGRQAASVREALLAVGLPCVLSGTSSVFATDAAAEWAHLLRALEQPHRGGRVRRLALSPLVGLRPEDLDGEPGQRRVDELAGRLRAWAGVLDERGVAALGETVFAERGLAERLLAREGGERLLTDLRHVGEALHRQAVTSSLGLAGLAGWLRDRSARAQADADTERARRLDTDAEAVQVMTVHASKGLEFPVVLVPYGWDSPSGTGDRTPRGHRPDGRRTRWLGGEAPGWQQACAEEDADAAGEELRLLYVACTRAGSRLVLWWVGGRSTASSPLHRLLLTPEPGAGVPLEVPVPEDAELLERAGALAGDGLRVDLADPSALVPVTDVPPPLGDPATVAAASGLEVAVLDRALDRTWRRSSYTSLTRDLHPDARTAGRAAGPVGSEPPADGGDEQIALSDDDVSGRSGDPRSRVSSPLEDLLGGTRTGTLVHAVLETARLDPQDDADTLLALERAAAAAGAADPAALARMLLVPVSTPLGPLLDGRSWREVAPADRLLELGFELPLAGGESSAAPPVLLGALADLLEDGLPADDPVRPWAPALREPALGQQVLRGYLTGSLDAVVRVGGRYVVVDHKTNRLGSGALTAWHYRREALDEAVRAAHYPLQALLYSVALHRFLRWRQPGYDPSAHLGGVLYLFLRGLCGPGVDAGVWSWSPPAQVVVAASDLLAGAAAATRSAPRGAGA